MHTYVHQKTVKNVQSYIICNSQESETTELFIKSRIDRIVICSYKGNDQTAPLLHIVGDFHKHNA